MVTKKSKKAPPRKTVRRHKSSTSGKIKLPLDVRSEKDLPAFKKLLSKKPLTIILVYATWCPHCHTIMPHFDAAAKSPNITVSPVTINETMLPKVNSFLQKNVNPKAAMKADSFPSIMIVGQNGETISKVNPVNDTETLTNLMVNSGKLAKESGMNQKANTLKLNSKKVKRNQSAEEVVQDVVENELLKPSNNTSFVENNVAKKSKSIQLNSISENNMANAGKNQNIQAEAKESLQNATAPSLFSTLSNKNRSKKSLKPSQEMVQEAEEILSMEAPVSPLSPPDIKTDQESVRVSNTLTAAQKVGGGRGGSLLQAMTRTTYTLAPAAILLATAASVMKRKSSKRHKTHKKTKRHH